MEKQIITKLHKDFEDCAHEKDGVEFWYARELQNLLGYDEWRNFEGVVERAKIACERAKQKADDHFVGVNKMVDLGSGSKRGIQDIMLTRYACYLIAQNGDPRKDEERYLPPHQLCFIFMLQLVRQTVICMLAQPRI